MIKQWAKEAGYLKDDDSKKAIKDLRKTIGKQFIVVKTKLNDVEIQMKNEVEKAIEDWLSSPEGLKTIPEDQRIMRVELTKMIPKILVSLTGKKTENKSTLTKAQIKNFTYRYLNAHFNNSNVLKENRGLISKKHSESGLDFKRINKLAGLED